MKFCPGSSWKWKYVHTCACLFLIAVQKIVHRVAGITHSLDSRLNDILHLEKEIKVKERRILDKGNEIFNSELNTIKKIDEILALQAVMSPAAAIVEAQ